MWNIRVNKLVRFNQMSALKSYNLKMLCLNDLLWWEARMVVIVIISLYIKIEWFLKTTHQKNVVVFFFSKTWGRLQQNQEIQITSSKARKRG